MKRAKPTLSIGSNEKKLKSFKKLKVGIISDDINVGKSKEVNNKRVGKAITGDQTKNITKDLSDVKKKPGKQEKNLESKSPIITSATKKGRIKSVNAPKGTKGDSTKIKTPDIVEDGKKEVNADTNLKRKRGRPFKKQTEHPEASLAVRNHDNGDAISEVNVEKVPDESCQDALTTQQKYNNKPVTGKRGKQRTISSITIEPSTQGCQDLSKQKENGNTEISVEKSLDTMPEDQPLLKLFSRKKHLKTSKSPPTVTKDKSQTLTFEKRSSLWSTIESMEAFRLIPQTPHFHPLNTVKETARERQAISLMVNFSGLFEDTSRLRINNPRTEIQDQFEKLSEFESHGFNIDQIKTRLTELLSVKDAHEKLGTRFKEVRGKFEKDNDEGKEIDNEIELIDEQVSELLEKRERVLKKKEQNDLERVALEAEFDRIEEAKNKVCKEPDALAAVLL